MKIDIANFEIPDIESWKNQVIREAKNENALIYENEIENIKIDISKKEFNKNLHSSLNNENSNDWDIASSFIINDSFESNKPILQCLQHGANHIYLEIRTEKPSWKVIFDQVILDLVQVTISFNSTNQIESFKAFLKIEMEAHFTISIDPFDINHFDCFKDTAVSFSINGFSVEQIGASSHQQLAILLRAGEYLLQKIKNPERIKFRIGIGSDFFIETAKIRALKWLWKHLLRENDMTCDGIYILGTIGWTNKSLNDPHMNLLRQTTEAIAGISGGISGLLIHPTSELTKSSFHWFDYRMALNVSHILKEESFLSKVCDPLNGSYIIEMLTNHIVNDSWDLFLVLHDDSLTENKLQMKEHISIIRNLKIQEFLNGEKQLLGINLFELANENKRTPTAIPTYLNLDYLIYENLQKDG